MASCLGNLTRQEHRFALLVGPLRLVTIILLILSSVVLLFAPDAGYQFVVVIVIVIAGLSPLWVTIHFLLLVHLQIPGRSLLSVIIPATLMSILILSGLHELAEALEDFS
jgi:hypothetical protein